MRDPDGSLSFEESTVVRRLREPLDGFHFLRSALAQRWMARGDLVKFEITDSRAVVAERLPFVTYPSEWCDAQLYSAAQLTLQLQREAVAEGFDLKDASAWNVIFNGTRPMFCDLLSFVPLKRRKWWAAGQFGRHFIVPLAVARRSGLHVYQSFQIWRDGIPADAARGLIGVRRFFTRYWPLMAQGKAIQELGLEAPHRHDDPKPDAIASFRTGLDASLAWMLHGTEPRPLTASNSLQGWEAYTGRRDHYHEQSMATKRHCIDEWLARLRPEWVADFGCNTGEFSHLAMAHGANVVAVDSDHDSVERMFRTTPPTTQLIPVVGTLDDLSGGRGWAGTEYASLSDRMAQRFDLVMMLAVIHHLVISASIPMEAVAAFCARCTRSWLVIELLDESDPQLRSLCTQRLREPGEFTLRRQRDAFAQAGFEVHEEVSLAPAPRILLLLRRRL